MTEGSGYLCAGCGERLHRFSPNHPDSPTDLMGCVNTLLAKVHRVKRAETDLAAVRAALASMFADMPYGPEVREQWFTSGGWRKVLAYEAMLAAPDEASEQR